MDRSSPGWEGHSVLGWHWLQVPRGSSSPGWEWRRDNGELRWHARRNLCPRASAGLQGATGGRNASSDRSGVRATSLQLRFLHFILLSRRNDLSPCYVFRTAPRSGDGSLGAALARSVGTSGSGS